jgi:hypothetical protein
MRHRIICTLLRCYLIKIRRTKWSGHMTFMEKCSQYFNWKIWKEGDHVKDVGITGMIMLKCILNLTIMRAYRPQWNSFCVCICLHVCMCLCIYVCIWGFQVVMPEACL